MFTDQGMECLCPVTGNEELQTKGWASIDILLPLQSLNLHLEITQVSLLVVSCPRKGEGDEEENEEEKAAAENTFGLEEYELFITF